MKVLLSIKPAFADSIFDGTKKYEYRKAIFREESVTTVIVYATKPVGKVVGEFSIGGVIEVHPVKLWGLTKEHAGITRKFFDEYFASRSRAYAIEVKNPRRYTKPKDIDAFIESGVAPQSFCYV
jgi:predicted transcriptional regulator